MKNLDYIENDRTENQIVKFELKRSTHTHANRCTYKNNVKTGKDLFLVMFYLYFHSIHTIVGVHKNKNRTCCLSRKFDEKTSSLNH